MEVVFNTDRTLLQVEKIHRFLTASYWGKGRTLEQTRTSLAHSLCFGMYSQTREQLGFARLATDTVFFGYLMDVFVFDEYQGRGLGTRFFGYILKHPVVCDLGTITLKTKDAHGFYEKFGFQRLGNSPKWMIKEKETSN